MYIIQQYDLIERATPCTRMMVIFFFLHHHHLDSDAIKAAEASKGIGLAASMLSSQVDLDTA
jgi:hypothetical protein